MSAWGKKPQKVDPDELALLQFRVPGWLKNDVMRHSKKLGVSMNAWVVEVLRAALRDERGIPQPPQAVNPPPTPADEIRAYIRGEKLLAPCGQPSPCVGMGREFFTHGGMSFCAECDIRVL